MLDFLFERVSGQVELFVLFLDDGSIGLPDGSFEGQELILHGLDLFEVVFSFLLGKFIDMVEKEPQVVNALRDS